MQFGSQRNIINHDFQSMVSTEIMELLFPSRFFGVEFMVHGDVGKTWRSINGRVCFVHDCFFVPLSLYQRLNKSDSRPSVEPKFVNFQEKGPK